MRALLLAAHGSRVESSNAEVRALCKELADHVRDRYDWIDCAFLELASPEIPEAIDRLVEQGATEIVVLPYFLVAGRHVREDIPTIIGCKTAAYPQVQIRLLEYLGSTPSMLDLIVEAASRRR